MEKTVWKSPGIQTALFSRYEKNDDFSLAILKKIIFICISGQKKHISGQKWHKNRYLIYNQKLIPGCNTFEKLTVITTDDNGVNVWIPGAVYPLSPWKFKNIFWRDNKGKDYLKNGFCGVKIEKGAKVSAIGVGDSFQIKVSVSARLFWRFFNTLK